MPRAARGALAGALLLLTACAAPAGEREWDPWEGWNRRVFRFNERVDEYALEPAARGWKAVTSQGFRTSVADFVANLQFPRELLNNLAQGRVPEAGTASVRFVLNSTLGLAGFLDPATPLGFPRQEADFGETLARWGVEEGPYLVLPLLGPSNPRDTAGLAGDWTLAAATLPDDGGLALVFGVGLVNWRALRADDITEAREASFDYYAAVRSAWLSQRRREVGATDAPDAGTPGPPSPAEEDPYDVDTVTQD